MPFASKAQARYLFAKEPKVAEEFAAETPNMGELPTRVNTRTGTNRQNANMLNERPVNSKKKKKSAWSSMKLKNESGGY